MLSLKSTFARPTIYDTENLPNSSPGNPVGVKNPVYFF